MTIFDDQKPVEKSSEVSNEDNTKSYIDQLVGEGKKFKTVEDLARGKLEADRYIEELREKTSQEEYSRKLLEKLQEQAAVAPAKTEVQENKSVKGEDNTSPKPENIESQLNEVLDKREREAKVRANLETVSTQMEELFGTEAKAALEKRANELGVTPEYLKGIAADSPSAFFTLIGEKPKQAKNPVLESSKNTLNFNSSDERDSKFYYDMWKKNPRQWANPATQKQMQEDKARLGTRFFV